MRLPDFASATIFNNLRMKMGAELIDWDTVSWKAVDSDDLLRKLNSLEGIIIDDISEIVFADDGTFEYKGQKVLVYIRDQKQNPKYYKPREYKFHICNCDVINKFIRNNRFDRYVVSTRTDGKFLVNIVNTWNKEYIEKDTIKELKVCKTCLMKLTYKGYRDYKRDNSIYTEFSLNEFFKKYKAKQFTSTPTYTEKTAPPDLYDSKAIRMNEKIKRQNNWSCQKCGMDLSSNKKYLHIHHINGVKSDNRVSNLRCLCIGCHSEEPDHKHLKYSTDYYKFIEIFK